MALKSDLETAVGKIFQEQWKSRDGQVIPASENLGLGNDAIVLDATVLYADLSGSTNMVDTYKAHLAAEIYKAYLHCAAKLIRSEGGTVTAYDGDRIMGVFIGDSKNTSAVRCGLKLNGAVTTVIRPAFRTQYPNNDFHLRQIVGVDTSKLWVARTGVRGANDLVWVGRAANYAAKLTEMDAAFPTWITKDVYSLLHKDVKDSSDGSSMWEERLWTSMGGRSIYRSNWYWKL